MTGESVSQSQPPEGAEQAAARECYLAQELDYNSVRSLEHHKQARFCAQGGCFLLGNDVKLDLGVGQAAAKVKPESQRQGRNPADGCAGSAIINYSYGT